MVTVPVRDDIVATYECRAEELARSYDALSPESVHAHWLHLLGPAPKARGALDIGAGTGRDALWLRELGYRVVAVEPAARFREIARRTGRDRDVLWLDDRLPELAAVRILGRRFHLVLLSAVWMHVPPQDRAMALAHIAELMAPGGLAVFSLRQGPSPAERPMHPARGQELAHLGQSLGLEPVLFAGSADGHGRPGVSWQTVALQKP